jgi:hypothetical protein
LGIEGAETPRPAVRITGLARKIKKIGKKLITSALVPVGKKKDKN